MQLFIGGRYCCIAIVWQIRAVATDFLRCNPTRSTELIGIAARNHIAARNSSCHKSDEIHHSRYICRERVLL
jgi:hypothetical protein